MWICRSPDKLFKVFVIECLQCVSVFKPLSFSVRYHESQLSEADWHLHSTHDPDEVQVDPRALSDVTDEEEVQVCLNIHKHLNSPLAY